MEQQHRHVRQGEEHQASLSSSRPRRKKLLSSLRISPSKRKSYTTTEAETDRMAPQGGSTTNPTDPSSSLSRDEGGDREEKEKEIVVTGTMEVKITVSSSASNLEGQKDSPPNPSDESPPPSPPSSAVPTPRAPPAQPLECLLCADTLRGLAATHARRPCCHQTCCDSCLHRHMTTIWEDALTGGQRPLTCPAGCGEALSDSEIRACLHRHHFHAVWYMVGCVLYYWCGFFVALHSWLFAACAVSPEPGTLQSCHRYRLWWYFLHTRSEQQAIGHYERWSINTGLRTLANPPTVTHSTNTSRTTGTSPSIIRHRTTTRGSSTRRVASERHRANEAMEQNDSSAENPATTTTTTRPEPVMIQHCPAPNCDYSWIVADPAHRRHKQMNERQRYFLWFSPPQPEQVGEDEEPWVEAEYLHFGASHSPPPPIDADHPDVLSSDGKKKDGRRMVCAKCHYVFCGLCRQPWMFLRNYHGGKSCREYQRCMPVQARGGGVGNDQSELAAVAAHTIGARMCPGCHTLTSRIDGCNHITCPCGREWCFVCGANWTPWHYTCTSRDPHERRLLGNNNDTCVIL